MNNYLKTLIHRMSKTTGTVLTDEHYRVLEYASQYYEKNRVGPLYNNLRKNAGATKQDIERLFPHDLNSVYTWVGIPIHSTDELCKPVPTITVENYREVYLDNSATTPPRKEVKRLLRNYFKGAMGFGNASSSTYLGKQAYNLVHNARTRIADCLEVKSKEIIFGGGGSEANNMAVKGIALQHIKDKGHIITSKIEHPSVLESARYLQQIGFDITYLDVDGEGYVSPQSVKDHLRKKTILVAIMAANNEIGTINPIEEIGKICRGAGVPFMVDAIQAFGRIKLKPKEMGIDLLSISGHKIFGPKGVGGLYVDEKISLTPLIHGGKQEFELRAGTENVASISAFGEAARLIHAEMEEENKRLLGLRKCFLSGLQKIVPDHIVNGSLENRLPQNLSIGFPNIDSGELLLALNQIGVFVSAGSACSAGSKEASHVLEAIGANTDHYGTIRFSFGLSTTKKDLAYLFEYLPSILEKLDASRENA